MSVKLVLSAGAYWNFTVVMVPVGVVAVAVAVNVTVARTTLAIAPSATTGAFVITRLYATVATAAAASVTVTVTANVPTVVGVPAITPVPAPIVRPGGKPEADQEYGAMPPLATMITEYDPPAEPPGNVGGDDTESAALVVTCQAFEGRPRPVALTAAISTTYVVLLERTFPSERLVIVNAEVVVPASSRTAPFAPPSVEYA